MKKCRLLGKMLVVCLMGTLLASCGTAKDKTENNDLEKVGQVSDSEKTGEKTDWKLDKEPYEKSDKSFKILHIMSYHEGWEWTEMQLQGFQEVFTDYDVEYKIFAMDAKKDNSEEWLTKKGEEAKKIIETWKPDLVYASDDEAQEYVTKNYINSDIPFVFSAVNKDAEYYGFDEAENITGSLEIEDFEGTIDLLEMIVPEVKSILIVCDTSEIWQQMLPRLEENIKKFPDIEFIIPDQIETYQEYQDIVTQYQGKVDGMLQVGIFNFKDENNENVPYQDVLKWTIANSSIPDVSFWIDRIANGTLCSVTISAYQHGMTAGKLAEKILVEGVSPKDLPMELNVKGEPAINIKRAEALGLDVSAKTLLSLKVYNNYLWEE